MVASKYILLFALAATAPSAFSFADTTYILCRSKKVVRTVRVDTKADEGTCKTQYSKEGIEQTVAFSRSSKACLSVLENIKNNLEKAAWSCKDISSSKISKEDMAAQ